MLHDTDQDQEQQESDAVRIETILRKLSQYSCHVRVHPTPPQDSTAKMEDESCATCDGNTNYVDELNIQIDSLRQGWMEDKSRHVQMSLDLQGMRHVIEACDVTFHELRQSKDGFLGNGLPLSQIAVDTIASYCDEQRKQHWDDNRASMDRKSSKMKKKAREMLESNQIFHEFAQSFNNELYRYSQWLDVRHRSLQDNYQRFCQIMQEQGAKPELLYGDHEVLAESQTAYREARADRLEAARKAIEAAQLHGLSDPFEGMDEV